MVFCAVMSNSVVWYDGVSVNQQYRYSIYLVQATVGLVNKNSIFIPLSLTKIQLTYTQVEQNNAFSINQ